MVAVVVAVGVGVVVVVAVGVVVGVGVGVAVGVAVGVVVGVVVGVAMTPTEARRVLVEQCARWKYGLAWCLASPAEQRWAFGHGEQIVDLLLERYAEELRVLLDVVLAEVGE